MKDQHNQKIAASLQPLTCNMLDGLSLALFSRYLKWSYEEIHVLLAEVKREIKNPAYQLYCKVYHVRGQKNPVRSTKK